MDTLVDDETRALLVNPTSVGKGQAIRRERTKPITLVCDTYGVGLLNLNSLGDTVLVDGRRVIRGLLHIFIFFLCNRKDGRNKLVNLIWLFAESNDPQT
jgi:hypothetical protein